MAVNTPGTLDAELQIQIYETQLRMESIPYDVFDFRSSEAVYTSKNEVVIPDDIYLKLTAEADNARTVKVPFLKALSGSPTLGSTGDQRGNEEDIEVKFFQAHYNDLSHAVSGQEYGILARDKMPYKIYEKITPLLSLWIKEYTGLMRRQALLERFSENLRQAPHSLTAEFGVNWYVPNVANGNQPAFDSNGPTHVNAIADALDEAGTTTLAAATVRYLQRLEEYATSELYIESIDVGGKTTYIVLLPSPQCRYLKDAVEGGQAGAIWRDFAHLNTEEMQFPGVLGRFGSFLLIVEDNRYPTLTVGGSGDSRTLTAQYKQPGRGLTSDPRDKTANSRQVGFLIGRAALCEWKPEDWHYEYEYEQYDKIYGKGAFASCGIEQVEYDISTGADDDSRQQDSSIILPFANVNNAAIS